MEFKTMLNPRTLSILFTISLSFASAHAGPKDGGGGNAVVCFKNAATVQSIRLNPDAELRGLILDSHVADIESVEKYDLLGFRQPLVPALAGENPADYTRRTAKRFETFFPSFAAFVRSTPDAFHARRTEYHRGPLFKIDDERPLGLPNPERCVVATIAVQKEESKLTWLTLDERLLNHEHHPLISRYALYVHEYLYRKFRLEKQDTDSVHTRRVVRLLMDAEPRSVEDIEAALKEIFGTKIFDRIIPISSFENWRKDLWSEHWAQMGKLTNPTFGAQVKTKAEKALLALKSLRAIHQLNYSSNPTGSFVMNDFCDKAKSHLDVIADASSKLEAKEKALLAVRAHESNLHYCLEIRPGSRGEKEARKFARAIRENLDQIKGMIEVHVLSVEEATMTAAAEKTLKQYPFPPAISAQLKNLARNSPAR